MAESFYIKKGKRIFDLAASATALLLLSPLLLVVAVAIKMSSKGPVFYRQTRIGQNGQPFRIVKFRSMRVNADRSGGSLTAAGDPRVTRIGQVLRDLKLDELPQFWNVLLGDMSLVGPRPEVQEYIGLFSEARRRVLTVRPGITDPASIAYRHEEVILGKQENPEKHYREVVLPDKLNLNLEYLDRMSFLYDVSLLLHTTGSVLLPKVRLK